MLPGFRRRILIEPEPGVVTAELEDDYHRMMVQLHHRDGIVHDVESRMKRAPWTNCPGAVAQLRATFVGCALEAVSRRGEKTSNCTHLYDLALFAAAHASESAAIAYDVHVGDPEQGRCDATLRRDGHAILEWTLENQRLVSPAYLGGRGLRELGDWIATLNGAHAEAARILRWATLLASGRRIDMPAGMSAEAFPLGACFNFQPAVACSSRRVAGADIDFSVAGRQPMADRARAFEPVP